MKTVLSGNVKRRGSERRINGLSHINQVQQVALLAKLDNRKHNRPQLINLAPVLDDITVQCPKCHTLETLQFSGAVMTPSTKFVQKNGLVYHDCGSVSPCRLFGRLYRTDRFADRPLK